MSPYYSGILGMAPDDPQNGPSFVGKLKSDGVISQKTVGLQINKYPTPSYVTIGGVSSNLMYNISDTQPVYYYKSSQTRRWYLKIHDLMIAKDDNTTYARLDDTGLGVHVSEATVDSFYRSILIPTAIFPTFMTLLDQQFNKTGAAAG